MTFDIYQLFIVTWWLALTYIVLMGVLALRLGWMRRSGAVEAPGAMAFLTGGLGLGAVAFIFSSRHKALKDSATTALVLICRTLFVLYIPLFVFLFSRFFV